MSGIDDLLNDPEDEDPGRRERRRENVSDFVRRAIKDTVGTVQSSSAPKEALHFLLSQGDRGRREFVKLVAKEFGDFLRHTDVSSELVKVLTRVQMDLSVKVRFRSTEDGGVQPVVEPADGPEAATAAAAEGSVDLPSDPPRRGPTSPPPPAPPEGQDRGE